MKDYHLTHFGPDTLALVVTRLQRLDPEVVFTTSSSELDDGKWSHGNYTEFIYRLSALQR